MNSDSETRGRVLVVDDHREMTDLLESRLEDHGWEARTASSGPEAVERFQSQVPDVVVTDLRMEQMDGFELLNEILDRDPDLPVIIMTAFGDVESAVEAIKNGAFHYITKPFDFDELEVFLERAMSDRKLRRQNRAYRRMNTESDALDKIVGTTEAITRLKKTIERAARSSAPVLITGESGTGKELAAHAVHDCSARRSEPFVPLNCAMVPENLLESELFGHTEGAFTGAGSARDGLFVEADGGSIFLDEIGDMPVKLQAKLLRALENNTIRPVGSDKSRKVDVRIIAATHRDLDEAVEEGKFREDLFYRLNVIPVRVPPLRARRKDIPVLIEHFIRKIRSEHPDAPVERFSDDVVEKLQQADWPGNVRQLKNVVERLFVMTDSPVVDADDYERQFSDRGDDGLSFPTDEEDLVALDTFTNEYIEWVVGQCDGNKAAAAEILDIDASTIYRRLGD